MIVFGLDTASDTGVAIGKPGATPRMHTLRLGRGGQQGSRFLQLFISLRELILEHHPTHIAIERALAAGGGGKQNRVQVAMGYRAAALMAAASQNIQPLEIPVQTIRKHFIGNGGLGRDAAKHAVMKRCLQLGWKVANDNESDAAAVWDMACILLRQEATAKEGSLFDGLRP